MQTILKLPTEEEKQLRQKQIERMESWIALGVAVFITAVVLGGSRLLFNLFF